MPTGMIEDPSTPITALIAAEQGCFSNSEGAETRPLVHITEAMMNAGSE